MVRISVIVTIALATGLGCNAILGIDEVSPRPSPDAAAGAQGQQAGSGGQGVAAAGASGSGSNEGGTGGAGGEAGASNQGGESAQVGGAGPGGAGGEGGSGEPGGAGGVGGVVGMGGEGGTAGNQGEAGMGGEAGAGGGAVCAVSEGSGRARLVNLSPSQRVIDFCFKPASEQDYATIVPVLSREGCPAGLGYQQSTVALAVSPGEYEIKVIDSADPNRCQGEALSISPLLSFEPGVNESVLVTPGPTLADPLAVVQHAESVPGAFSAAIRFFHASPDAGDLDWGIATASKLPADLTVALATKIPFKAMPPEAETALGTTDGRGYTSFQLGGTTLSFAIATAGTSKALRTRSLSMPTNAKRTLYVTGTTGDPRYPLELLDCDETDPAGPLATCGREPIALTADVYAPRFAGAFDLHDQARFAAWLEVVPTLTDDALCLVELWSDEKKEAVLQAATQFADIYSITTDQTTPASDPSDIDGLTPQPPQTPPCSTPELAAKLDAMLDCSRDHWSTNGSEDGVLTNGADLGGTCFAQGAALRFATPLEEAKRCYSCMFSQLASYETFASTRDTCKNAEGWVKAFRGGNSTLLLSRYPIIEREALVLPSTEWNNVILRATLKLPAEQPLDVYCGLLTAPPGSETTRPYTGPYGKGPDTNPWANEQALQASRLLDLIETRSTALGRRALVLLQAYAGPEHKVGGETVLTARSPLTFGALQASLARALPSGYGPTCTYCSSNPLVGGTVSTWETHAFVSNIPITQVRSASVELKDLIVDTGQAKPDKVPLSTHYLLRTNLEIRE